MSMRAIAIVRIAVACSDRGPELLFESIKEGIEMSLLKKIIATICPDNAQPLIVQLAPATPGADCFTAEATLGGCRFSEEENPTRQRRYYVKTGRYVDSEEEMAAAQSATAEAVIFDKSPVDLKSLFPKLSLR